MSQDEAEVKLIPTDKIDACHQKSAPLIWRIWKLLTLVLIFSFVCVWIVFTMYPSIEATSTELGDEMEKAQDTGSFKGNCTYPNSPNTTHVWKGFEEIVPGTLIYSVYFDDTHKTPSIRMIAISETFRPPRIFCHSICGNNEIQEAAFHLIRGHKQRRHAAFIVSCQLPTGVGRGPRFVSVSAEYDKKRSQIFTFPVTSLTHELHIMEYTVCVPPLFGNEISPTNFIEFVEMNHIFGAKKFYIYNDSIHKELSKVVNNYQTQGVVMVMPWRLPHYLKDFYAIHYHGQLVAIQDCLYRNRGKTKLVGFYDLDEFLVPLKQPTITSVLKTVYKYDASGYCIQMVLFPKNNVFTAEDSKNNSLITQQFVFRTRTAFPKRIRSKCIVDPLKVFDMGIHYINKPVYGNYLETWVSPKKALVFHYRQCVKYSDLKEACRSLQAEGFMLKYKKQLKEKVNHMLALSNT